MKKSSTMLKPTIFCDSTLLISLHINCWHISDGTKKKIWLMKRNKEPLHNCIRRIAIANMPVSDYVEKSIACWGCLFVFVFHVFILIVSNKRHHHKNKNDNKKSNAVIAVVNVSHKTAFFSYCSLFAFLQKPNLHTCILINVEKMPMGPVKGV